MNKIYKNKNCNNILLNFVYDATGKQLNSEAQK